MVNNFQAASISAMYARQNKNRIIESDFDQLFQLTDKAIKSAADKGKFSVIISCNGYSSDAAKLIIQKLKDKSYKPLEFLPEGFSIGWQS